MRKATSVRLEIRKRTRVRLGAVLVFEPVDVRCPDNETRTVIAKYRGATATIVAFAESDKSIVNRILAHAKGEQEPKVVMGKIFVRFEDGYRPKNPLSTVHFVAV